jgi:alginate O-acetyltransferase complex protein AlgI
MLFNDYIFFLIFLPIVCASYFILGREFWKTSVLVGGSIAFYMYWNPWNISLILGSLAFNFFLGKYISRKKRAKEILTLGIIGNLLPLAYYKYSTFFFENLNSLGANFRVSEIILPLAISFFTFQQIAYLVDCYRLKKFESSFLVYSKFVLFFPQLIAGPIVHHNEMMSQFKKKSLLDINYDNISKGIFIFTIGLFKKNVLADQLSIWANQGYDQAGMLSTQEAWATSFAYSFQLYFDFSGYCDMAIGSALLFNINLPDNFNSPYKAINIQDFWRRWHMTLSRWLRDYVYIPLGGNRSGENQTFRNIFLTFLIGGIWHGAGWQFIAWGTLHGLGIVFFLIYSKLIPNTPKLLAVLTTFLFINTTWVFFRSENISDAWNLLTNMCQFTPDLPQERKAHLSQRSLLLFYILFSFLICFLTKNSQELARKFSPNFIWLTFTFILFFLALTFKPETSEFLYFNF